MTTRSIKEVRAKKKEFVDLLKPAILKLGYINDVEYRAFDNSEFVRIEWEGCGNDYICMTGNSCEAILAEITRDIYKNGIRPVGLIRHPEHCKILDEKFGVVSLEEEDETESNT